MKLEELKQKMDQVHYIYDDTLATVLAVALELGRPLLIEGAALQKLCAMEPPVLTDAVTLLVLSNTKTADQAKAFRALTDAYRRLAQLQE